jgi:hypothetical protein
VHNPTQGTFNLPALTLPLVLPVLPLAPPKQEKATLIGNCHSILLVVVLPKN